LRQEKAAAEGNNPDEQDDEETQMHYAINLSRAEAKFRRGVKQRGGEYEHGGGSGSARGNALHRMFQRATSQRGAMTILMRRVIVVHRTRSLKIVAPLMTMTTTTTTMMTMR
jgi:hypothetical protein